MALIQVCNPGSGGGGGGIAIEGFQVDTHTQTTNFLSGGVVIALSQTPISAESIIIDYNGQRLLYGVSWSYDGAGNVTIDFADPYVTSYETDPVFQITYPY